MKVRLLGMLFYPMFFIAVNLFYNRSGFEMTVIFMLVMLVVMVKGLENK